MDGARQRSFAFNSRREDSDSDDDVINDDDVRKDQTKAALPQPSSLVQALELAEENGHAFRENAVADEAISPVLVGKSNNRTIQSQRDSGQVVYADLRRRSWSRFTRDTGIATCAEDRILEIREAEMYLRCLPVLSFPVSKLFGRYKRDRLLRLTQGAIENIHPKTGKVSSSYAYRAVRFVRLRAIDTLVISYTAPIDASRPKSVPRNHDYVYQTPVAVLVIQEIEMRVAIDKSTAKKKFTFDVALKYQQQLHASTQYAQAARASSTAPSQMSSHHAGPGRTPSTSDVNSDGTVEQDGQDPNSTSISQRNSSKTKLGTLLGVNATQRTEVEVEKILLDKKTTEGQAVVQFQKNIPGLCKKFAKSPDTAGQLTLRIRQFLDAVTSMISTDRRDALLATMAQGMLLSSVEAQVKFDDDLTAIVEKIVERVVLTPFVPTLMKYLRKHAEGMDGQMLSSQSKILADHLSLLKELDRDQAWFGIAPEFRSPTNFASAVVELNAIDTLDMPSDIIQQLLACVRSIYNTVTFEQLQLRGKTVLVAADEFLPIFIFVVSRSDVHEPLLLCEFLWNFCDTRSLSGEGGYYLTVFASALQYLLSLDPRISTKRSAIGHSQNQITRRMASQMRHHSSFIADDADASGAAQHSTWLSARPEYSNVITVTDNAQSVDTQLTTLSSSDDDSACSDTNAAVDLRERAGPYGAVLSSAQLKSFLPPHLLLRESKNRAVTDDTCGTSTSTWSSAAPTNEVVENSFLQVKTSRKATETTEERASTVSSATSNFVFKPFARSFRSERSVVQSVPVPSDSSSDSDNGSKRSRSMTGTTDTTSYSLASSEFMTSIGQMQRELERRGHRLSRSRPANDSRDTIDPSPLRSIEPQRSAPPEDSDEELEKRMSRLHTSFAHLDEIDDALCLSDE